MSWVGLRDRMSGHLGVAGENYNERCARSEGKRVKR